MNTDTSHQVVTRKSNYPRDSYYWVNVTYIASGLYDHKKIEPKWLRNIYLVYQIYMILWCPIIFYSCQIAYLDQTKEDMQIFLDNIGMILTQTVGILKWFVMIRFNLRIQNMQAKLDSEDYHYENWGDLKPAALKTKGVKIVKIMVICFITFAYGVTVMKDSIFLKDYFKILNDFEDKGTRCADVLPYEVYVPFIAYSNTPWRCFWAFIYQAIPLTLFAGPIIAFDLTFFSTTIYTCVNFICIRESFRTMRSRCLARLDLPDDYTVLNDSDNPMLEKEIRGEVRKLSVHLQDQIKIVTDLENICKFVLLGQAFTTTFVLITILYLVATEMELTPFLISQIQYAAAINIQLFTFCFMGDAVTEHSANVAEGIYSSDWLSCTKSVKMDLVINIMRLQRPLYFTIGKFQPLTLNTYLQIIKGSYSYYTMFSSMT